jgi:hypothetical protein
MSRNRTLKMCFLMILICTVNCTALEISDLPKINIVENENEVPHDLCRTDITLRISSNGKLDSDDYNTHFKEYVKKYISKEQVELLLTTGIQGHTGLYGRDHRQTITFYAVTLSDAKTMAAKFIEFFNDLHERNLANLPNEFSKANKLLQKLKQDKQKAIEELSEVKHNLNSIRAYPYEYTDTDIERVKNELNSLRFLKKKTDIEIAGIQARAQKAQEVLSDKSSQNTDLREHVVNLYTEAQIMYADAQARSNYISKLTETYHKAITLFRRSNELPETIKNLTQVVLGKNGEIARLREEIDFPEDKLSTHRKPLNVLSITIYDNSLK